MLAALALSIPVATRAQVAPGFMGTPGAGIGTGQAGAAAPGSGAAAGALPTPSVPTVEDIRSNDAATTAAATVPATPPAQAPGATAPGTRPAPRAPTDFQLFAQTSTGVLLPVFGQDLFTAPPSTFAPVIDLPPSADYTVGAGDEVAIRGWGQVNIDVRTTVARDGTISIPRVGVVPVAGVRYDQLQNRIKDAVGRYYRNFELSVSLGRMRSIQILVVGHVQKPGVYTISSMSTLANALLAAGGPSSTGSMRSVQLRRGTVVVREFDLYDVLLRGDKSGDVHVQSGDVLFIPPAGPLAAIVGPVKTPAIYELKGETSLADVIGYAGGVTTTAATSSILLERLDQQRGRVEQEVAWNDANLRMPLRGGDVIQLRPISPKFFNAVTVRGSIVVPFRTAWREGMKVSDLIPDVSSLISMSYWARAASRALPAAPPAASRREEAQGAQSASQARVSTEVENLVEEVNWDYAVVERLDRAAIEPQLIPFNLRKAIVDRDAANDLQLQPGDIVTVFSQKDILAPSDKRTFFVRVEGEVLVPGVYQVKPGDTLRQVLARAGGLTPKSYLFGAEFNRESVRREQQRRLDDVAQRAEDDAQRAAKVRLSRSVAPEDTATVAAQAEAQRQIIARLRTVRATGRMVLDLRPTAHSANDLPDLVLEDGDRLFVPTTLSTVGVYGSVYNSTNYLYKPGKRLKDYLNDAGGPTRYADTGSIYVLRADGSVTSRSQGGWFSGFDGTELMPADTVVVPEEFAPISWTKELKDWTQILYQMGLGAAAIKVITQ